MVSRIPYFDPCNPIDYSEVAEIETVGEERKVMSCVATSCGLQVDITVGSLKAISEVMNYMLTYLLCVLSDCNSSITDACVGISRS